MTAAGTSRICRRAVATSESSPGARFSRPPRQLIVVFAFLDPAAVACWARPRRGGRAGARSMRSASSSSGPCAAAVGDSRSTWSQHEHRRRSRRDLPVPSPASDSYYVAQQKIYPREVRGRFARLRTLAVWVLLGLFYVMPWVPWNGRQAVLFDLPARKFYIFGLVLWPQDFIFLTGAADHRRAHPVLLHRARGPPVVRLRVPADGVDGSVPVDGAGRRRRSQRAHEARSRAVERSASSRARRLKQLLWITLRAVDRSHVRRLLHADRRAAARMPRTLSLGPWEAFWSLFYGFATYGNAGYLREQVCKYMCPYARFQSAMFDRDTLSSPTTPSAASRAVRAGAARNPRSGQARRLHRLHLVRAGVPHRHRYSQGTAKRVHRLRGVHRCVRHGHGQDGLSAWAHPLHHAECARAQARAHPAAARDHLRRAARPLIAGFAFGLARRTPVDVDVIRDRNALYRLLDDGRVENVYDVKILNKTERASSLHGHGARGGRAEPGPVAGAHSTVRSGEVFPAALRVRRPAYEPSGSQTIEFVVQAEDMPTLAGRPRARVFWRRGSRNESQRLTRSRKSGLAGHRPAARRGRRKRPRRR